MGFFSNPLKKAKKIMKKVDPVGSKVVKTAVKMDRKVVRAGARLGAKSGDPLSQRLAKAVGGVKTGGKIQPQAKNTGVVGPRTGGGGQVSSVTKTGPGLGGTRPRVGQRMK